MRTYIALLRGINVGGTGLLPMKDLAALCSGLGFQSVRTYIQSGNVLLQSTLSERAIRSLLEKALEARMGKMIQVMVRSPEEMRRILERNPFPGRERSKVAVGFLNQAPPPDLVSGAEIRGGEEVQAGRREIYVYYPAGMGRSKLKLPLKGAPATFRNINTVAKLVAMTDDFPGLGRV